MISSFLSIISSRINENKASNNIIKITKTKDEIKINSETDIGTNEQILIGVRQFILLFKAIMLENESIFKITKIKISLSFILCNRSNEYKIPIIDKNPVVILLYK
jgi:hypothetical protein